MRIADLKLVLSFCVCTALAYHHGSKDYSKWRERLGPTTTTTPSGVVVHSANDIYYENLKLRHRSRFPNLDRVMVKIDNMAGHKKAADPAPTHNRVRHQNIYRPTTTTSTTTTTDEGLFGDDYADLEYDEDNNEDLSEYDDWEGESDDSLDDYEDDTFDNEDPFDDDDDEEWQAEEATEPPVSAPVSSLTKYKWDNYGTRSKVEQSRRQQLHLRPSAEIRATNAVVDHYMKVKEEGQCRKPFPRVISVQSEYPNPSKTYTPHCTILHRCAEDTGCCSNSDTKCGPKVQVPVQLYFYTRTLGVSETKVEKLTFYNHTECACLEKSKQPVTKTIENSLGHGLVLKMATGPSSLKQCRCPEMFTPKFRYDSRCSCDCEENNQDCIRMKKGKEFFSLTDRMCIMENGCGVPACEYGVYMREIGRCQRKQEKFDSYSKLTVT